MKQYNIPAPLTVLQNVFVLVLFTAIALLILGFASLSALATRGNALALVAILLIWIIILQLEIMDLKRKLGVYGKRGGE